MTSEDREMIDRINQYAEEVLADIDPENTRVSFQLEKLKPIMEEIATEKGMSVEDLFIRYMDLASEVSVEKDRKFRSEFGNPSPYGDVNL
ncbi:MAG TPA: hypothetical protein VJZ01_06760 [Lachnospiraceae bacterium]|nr:hypothetical protein [Lachnospiraceae bacterium]